MENRPAWALPDIDLETASLARVYDHQLGGAHNFAVDRRMAEEIERAMPGFAREGAVANRAFLGRAVRFAAAAGIDQFLDVGSGIPTVGNVHEVAQQVNPDARTLYVDIDAVAVIMGREILADDPNSAAIQGDLRSPATILDDPETHRLIDFDRPVAVLLVSVLHAIPDSGHPGVLTRRLTAPAVAGSMLVVSHLAPGLRSDAETAAVAAISGRSATPATPRNAEQVRTMMGRFDPVEPGIVPLNRWRPDRGSSSGSRDAPGLGAVGRLA